MVVSYTYCIVFLFCPRYVYGGVLNILYYVFCFVLAMCLVVSYTYCIMFFVLSSLCVWWCPIHIVLCFLFCPRYVSGGVLCVGHHHTHNEAKPKNTIQYV
jgi:cellulose synthase/poly-beta-1,6-N-acetylglucosamine synthase-like glycosyltransferase